MAELKYTPVPHNHQQFLVKAAQRKGFKEAYESLELEYKVTDQLIKARSRAGLTQDAVTRMIQGRTHAFIR